MTTPDDGNQQPSGLRGDPGALRTVNADSRDPHSSSSSSSLATLRRQCEQLLAGVTKAHEWQCLRRDREDDAIEYQIFADCEPEGEQIAWVQSTRHDAEFIAAAPQLVRDLLALVDEQAQPIWADSRSREEDVHLARRLREDSIAVGTVLSVAGVDAVNDERPLTLAERVKILLARLATLEAERDGARMVAQQMQERLGAAQEDLTALRASLRAQEPQQKEIQEETVTRVDGVPRSAHGDLPQRPTE